MSSSWTNTTLGALADQGSLRIQTGPFGAQLHSHDYVQSGVPVVPTEAIGRRRLKSIQLPLVSSETAERLSRHRLMPGDIVFARRGVQATGYSAIIEGEQDGWICGTGAMLLRADSSRISPRFLSWLFSSDQCIRWLKAHAVGAVMPSLNDAVLRLLPLRLPPLDVQHRIAQVLDSFDCVIKNGLCLQESLEVLSQRMFKSWFVDFDPVLANAKGVNPVLPKELNALFPSNFGDDGLPDGWQLGTIADLANISGGSTPSTKEERYWYPEQHCWATPKDLSTLKTPVLLDTERKISDAGLARIGTGLLPAGTVLLSSRAPIGYLALAEVPVAVNQGFIAMQAKPQVSNLYLLWWTHFADEVIRSRANGSTFQEISKTNFRPIPAIVPPARVMQAFDELVRPLHDRMVVAEKHSRTLAALCDALLPKLLSGEICVPEAERMLEAAGV